MTSKLLEEQLPVKQRGAYKDIPNDVVEINHDTGEEVVWFRTTPPGPQTETAINSLVSDYDELMLLNEIHPLILIAAFIVHFLAIHPFRDGNGRLSRLLTVFLLLKADYSWCRYVSHEKVIEDNKEGYYVSLRDAQGTFSSGKVNYDRWFEFFLKTLCIQGEVLLAKLNSETPVSELNMNEKKVFEIIRENGKCNIGFILEQVDMSRNGMKSLLRRLVDRGIIKNSGVGKGTFYLVE